MRPSGLSRWLWAILLAALAVRFGAAVVWQQRFPDAQAFAFPDSESYWELGRRIAQGDAYEFSGSRAFRTPGYPLLLAPLFWIFAGHPPVIAARVVGVLLGTATVGGIAWLTRSLFNERAMLIAALMAALYLEAIAMSVLVLSEALFCPLMVAQLLLWTFAWKEPTGSAWEYSLGAGLCAGLAVLTRPSWLLFTPLAIAISLIIARRPARDVGALTQRSSRLGSFRPALLSAALVCLAMTITLAPWWIRNYVVLQAFVPTSSETGPSLYDGLHDGATGASDMRFVPCVEFEFLRVHPELHSDSAAREVALNRHFASAAIDWAIAHPGRTFELAWIKLGRMWNIWPNEASLRSWPLRAAVAIGYVPLLVLGGIGAVKFARCGFPYALCLLPAIYFSLLHTVFVGSIRYRQPAMLMMIVLAAGAADWLWSRYQRQ
jgi:4-amino-4-deoxy-L-arabinose transferase-like glycosyltransferase